jgi:DNA-binding MarR family transcriptional regulator
MNDQVLDTLREILKWTKIQALPSVKATLQSALPKAENKKLYQQLDGTQTQQQIAKALGISQPTISRLVSAWSRAGIVEEKSPGKYIHSFDLEELGIDEKD